MNTVIATWLHAKENKDVNKTYTNAGYLGKEDGTRHKVCLFLNLLLQIFSPIFKNVLVFFVIFLKDKNKIKNNRKYACWLCKHYLIFIQLRFWDLAQRWLDYKIIWRHYFFPAVW